MNEPPGTFEALMALNALNALISLMVLNALLEGARSRRGADRFNVRAASQPLTTDH